MGTVGTADASALAAEVDRLRAELTTARSVSARALARATRLGRLVSAVGQLTDVTAILDNAVCEVAEQFGADVATVLLRADGAGGVRIGANWGIPARHLPCDRLPVPDAAVHLTAAVPVVAGPAADVAVPDWLTSCRPQHVAVGLLAVRGEDLGFLLLARRADEPFETTEVQELGSVVSRIALALDNGQLYGRLQEQLHRLRRLHQLTAELAAIMDPAGVARALAQILVAEVPVGGAAAYLRAEGRWDPAGRAGTLGDDDGPPVSSASSASSAPGEPCALPGFGGEAPGTPSGTVVVPLGSGAAPRGALVLRGLPPPGSEARMSLDHLVDVGGLVLEKALLFAQTAARAERDSLTGLANRRHFLTLLASGLARARAAGADLGVVFVDLDAFKAVNDTWGHEAGDQLLTEVACRLRGAIREGDVAARIGGDEFVVLCEDVTDEDLHGVVVARVQRALDAPYVLHLADRRVTVATGGSVGVGTAIVAGYDRSALLAAADAAMYAQKQERRRRRTPATSSYSR